MWVAVTKRFQQFHQNILLTENQRSDGTTKHKGVRSVLNSHYYGTNSETQNSMLVGSWGKFTRVRPPRDIDILFELPHSVYERFSTYVGNRQSAILQDVKNVLQSTYSNTDMSGDGQVVVVKFTTFDIEVVPAFKLHSGQYWICDTHDGGSYKTTDPVAEQQEVSRVHNANNKNLRPIIRILKAWQSHCNVPLKSFFLELVAIDYLEQCQWRNNGLFYYDWIMRDFFEYLQRQENGYVIVPGTYEVINLGNAWKSRCDTASNRAIKACTYEHEDEVILAGIEWQKIFGTAIPLNP